MTGQHVRKQPDRQYDGFDEHPENFNGGQQKQNRQRHPVRDEGPEETAQTVAQFKDDHGYSFPMAPDPDRAIYDQYAIEGIPRTVLITPDGVVAISTLGFYEKDLAELESEIDSQLERR